MMRRAPLLLLALSLFALPLAASADAVAEAPIAVAPTGHLYFGGVRVHGGDAPQEDQQRVAGVIDGSLRQAHRRVQRCLTDNHVRFTGQHRGQRMEGSVTFNRAERPSGIRLSGGLPPAAERCVREVAQTLYVRPAPRGSVELRFTYRVR